MSATRSLAARHACLAADAAACASGFLRVYTGPRPASPDAPATGVLLVAARLAAPAFAAPSGGSMAALPLAAPVPIVQADGDAGWFRVTAADGSPLFDGDCGRAGSGATLTLRSPYLMIGGLVAITSLTLSQP